METNPQQRDKLEKEKESRIPGTPIKAHGKKGVNLKGTRAFKREDKK